MGFRVGGTFQCRTCRQAVVTCCEGPVANPLPDPVAIREARSRERLLSASPIFES